MSTAQEEPRQGECILIKNETVDGKKFRPSDWADRLQSTLSCLGDEEFGKCISMVQIVNLGGNKCILLDKSLNESEPRLYRFLMRFCEENRLATESRDGAQKEIKAAEKQTVNSFRRSLSL